MPPALKILASGQVAQQLITINGAPTGGTWTPFVNGASAGTVAFNASAATLQTALRTVLANVAVSGSAGGPYTITCPTGQPAVITLGANNLTGGTSPLVAMSGVETTIYTVPGSSAVKIANAVVTNVSLVAVTLTVSVVPSGGAVDGTHRVINAYSLGANEATKLVEVEGGMYDAGSFFSVNIGGAAGALTYLLTGAVIA